MNKIKDLLFLWTRAWGISPSYCLVTIVHSVFTAAVPLVGIVGVGTVVDALIAQAPMRRTLEAVIVYTAVTFGVAAVKELLLLGQNHRMRTLSDAMQFDFSKDSVHIDYHHAQDGALFNLRRKSMMAHPAIFIAQAGALLGYVVQFAAVAYVVTSLNPVFLLFLSATSAVSCWMIFKTKRHDYDYRQGKVDDDRKLDYLYKTMTEYQYAKDIRMNDAQALITAKYEYILNSAIRNINKLGARLLRNQWISAAVTVIQTVAMYGFFSYQVFTGRISIAQYTVLLGAVTLLVTALARFFESAAFISTIGSSVSFYREYQTAVDNNSQIIKSNAIAPQDIDFERATIRFEEVSFAYPGTDCAIFKGLNLVIHPGEKLGVVGLNGSGKTTLIKLLTRLYDPSSGRITLGDVDIREIPYRQYAQHIGVVLQDYLLFAYSIKENVTLENAYDEDRLRRSIDDSGLTDKIDTLSLGMDTSVYKTLDENGVEFSGGEGQKLAMARAIYKDAALLILDEPTSALDPLAEYDFFTRLKRIAGSRTAIFISHRLSSTQFCDRIIVLSNGEIVESGNHEALMDARGLYASLFLTQARYYREMGVEHP